MSIDYGQLIFGILALVIGVFYFKKIFKKHQRIDTESIAVVKEVQDLGRDDGRKVYAIRYTIQSSTPFDIVIYPCKKALPIGKERVIYYEKDDAEKNQSATNYYFKTIKGFDKRFIAPCCIIMFGVLSLISVIILAMK